MSLHAQLSPEAEARLEAQRRNSVVTSIVIALLAIALVVGWAVVVGFLTFEPPYAGAAGNGYFGAWGGLLSASFVMWHEM